MSRSETSRRSWGALIGLILTVSIIVLAFVVGAPTARARASGASLALPSYNYDVATEGAPARSVEGLPSTVMYEALDAERSAALGARPSSVALVVATNTADDFANWGGEFVDDAIRAPATRPDFANISAKIERQMQTRGWTPDLIDEAVTSGNKFPAVNKLGGANTPATRYVNPTTGQSVIIDRRDHQSGRPGFKYGP